MALLGELGEGQLFPAVKSVLVISQRVPAFSLVGAIVADVASVLHVLALYVFHHVVLLKAAVQFNSMSITFILG
jgi:hypothetical protein